MTTKPLYNLDPITHDVADILHMDTEYLDNLYQFITSSIEAPYSLSVNGNWGSGKTTLMKNLKKKFEEDKYPVLWFNPWEYERADDIAFCFLVELHNFVKNRSHLKGVFKEFGIFGFTLLVGSVDVAASLLTNGKVSFKNTAEMYGEVKKAFENRYDKEENLVEIIKKDFAELTQKLAEKYEGKPLIVFFDDLDRCLPDKALDLLEALKNLFIVKDARVIFISGIDTQVAKQFIIMRYNKLESDFAYNYFKKIFNFTVNMPALTEENFKKLIKKRLDELLEGKDNNKWKLPVEERDALSVYFSELLVKAGVKSIRQAYNVLHNCYFMLNMNSELQPKYKELFVLYTIKECKSDFFETCCKLANKNPDGRFFAEIQSSKNENLESELKDPFLSALLKSLKKENGNLINEDLLKI